MTTRENNLQQMQVIYTAADDIQSQREKKAS